MTPDGPHSDPLLRDPKTFPGQTEYIIPSVSSGSIIAVSPVRHAQKTLDNRQRGVVSVRCSDQIPTLPLRTQGPRLADAFLSASKAANSYSKVKTNLYL